MSGIQGFVFMVVIPWLAVCLLGLAIFLVTQVSSKIDECQRALNALLGWIDDDDDDDDEQSHDPYNTGDGTGGEFYENYMMN